MFVNNASGQHGLVCQYDVIFFNEVSDISFDSKDGVNIMKGYMYSNTVQLVGDRAPRSHVFSLQLRSFDASKKGVKLVVPALIALCSALLKKSVKGGLIVVGYL